MAVTYGNGRWIIAFGITYKYFVTSNTPNVQVSWQSAGGFSSNFPIGLEYFNGMLIACSQNIMTAPDTGSGNFSFTQRVTNANVNTVRSSGRSLVAVAGSLGNTATGNLYYSSDGINWTAARQNTSWFLRDIIWVGYWLCLGTTSPSSGSTYIMYHMSEFEPSGIWQNVLVSSLLFVAAGASLDFVVIAGNSGILRYLDIGGRQLPSINITGMNSYILGRSFE